MPLPHSMFRKVAPRDTDLELIAGRWPTDISGELMLSSPDPRDAGPHAFYGDGLMYRISLSPGTHGAPPNAFALRQKKLVTPSRMLRDRLPDAFQATPVGTMSAFGPTNAANTAPLPWNDRLLATWDGGRPLEIDPLTLETLGEVGHRESWDDLGPEFVLPMIVTPAHPVTDPDRGCIWTSDYQPGSDRVGIVRIDPSSSRVQRWPLPGAEIPQLMHTISQTREWVILADNAMKIDQGEAFGRERAVTTNQTQPVYLVRKADLEATPSGQPVDYKRFVIGPEAMHFYAAYDDSDGIRVLFEHSTDSDIAMSVRPGDYNLWGEPIDPAVAGMYGLAQSPPAVTLRRFDPETGEVLEQARYSDPELMWNVQTSAQDWSPEGVAKPTLHHVIYSGFRPEGISERQRDLYAHRVNPDLWPTEETPGALVAFDWNNELRPRSSHRFAQDEWATTPVFAPRNASTGSGTDGNAQPYEGGDPGGHDGYVLVSVLCDRDYRLEVFDANDLGKGPVAVLASRNYTMPFVIHGAWMPCVGHAPDAPRVRFSDELRPRHLEYLSRTMKSAVHEVAEEYDTTIDAAARRRAAPTPGPKAARRADP